MGLRNRPAVLRKQKAPRRGLYWVSYRRSPQKDQGNLCPVILGQHAIQCNDFGRWSDLKVAPATFKMVYAEGEIELKEVKEAKGYGGSRRFRVAPSFSVSAFSKSTRETLEKAYTAKAGDGSRRRGGVCRGED